MSESELLEYVNFTYPGSTLAQGKEPANGLGFSAVNYSFQNGHLYDEGPLLPGQMFRNDIKRTDDQFGVFGELSYDMSDDLTLTFGARYYDIEIDFDGSATSSFGNFTGATGADVNSGGTDIADLFDGDGLYQGLANDAPENSEKSGSIFKLTASYTMSDDILLYATVSEGFRSGFLNRPGGRQNPAKTYTVPYAFDTDEMMNYEFGWKADLLDGTMRLNGSIFKAEIDGLQTTIFDPSIVNLFFSDNSADAEVTGMEVDMIWAPASVEGLTISGGLSILDTEIVEKLVPTDDVQVGDSLAFAPELQANLQARYEWSVSGGMTAHIMPHMSHSDESYSDIIRINRDLIADWTMFGLTAGLSNDTWGVELFIDNLTDERAELSRSYINDRERVSYSRPRTTGLRMTYNF